MKKASLDTTLISINIVVLGHRTSIRLEPEMWEALKSIAKIEKCKTNDICSIVQISKGKNTSLTAAIRVFIMLYYQEASNLEGHIKAGHGNFLSMLKKYNLNPEKFRLLQQSDFRTRRKSTNSFEASKYH